MIVVWGEEWKGVESKGRVVVKLVKSSLADLF